MDQRHKIANYRDSHASENYGGLYNSKYSSGYYYRQWEDVEKKILVESVKRFASREAEVLDFACGTGRISVVVAQHVGHVMGVDVSGAMLASATRAHNVTYLQHDLTGKGLGKTFDLITSFRFFLNAEQLLREQALAALHAHLKDDGYFIFNVHMNSRSIVGRIISGLSRVTTRFYHKILSESEVRTLLKRAGFEIVEVRYYSFLPRLGGKVGDALSVLMKGVESVANALPVPRSLGQSFIVVARKR
ncbi:MAG: class I SAM-dependent methyltransferase [Alphaproteobacteria bacterium]|nr:MAG: class I SAM-dependent methyltransferase [Alphaproteobacteria bacterium]